MATAEVHTQVRRFAFDIGVSAIFLCPTHFYCETFGSLLKNSTSVQSSLGFSSVFAISQAQEGRWRRESDESAECGWDSRYMWIMAGCDGERFWSVLKEREDEFSRRVCFGLSGLEFGSVLWMKKTIRRVAWDGWKEGPTDSFLEGRR